MQQISLWMVNSLTVTLVVLIHYEALFRLTRLIPLMGIKHQYRIVVGVFGALIAHAIEIWIFGWVYYLMVTHLGWGSFAGNYSGEFLDNIYFSFTTYTTLGYGDIEPYGSVRYLAGIESLTGLVLITWTASFLYIEMQEYWRRS